MHEHPERRCLSYLWATHVTALDKPPRELHLNRSERRKLEEAVAAVQGAPRSCDAVGDRLLEWADHAIRLGERPIAAEIADTVAIHCDDPVLRHEGTLRRARLRWEADRDRATP